MEAKVPFGRSSLLAGQMTHGVIPKYERHLMPLRDCTQALDQSRVVLIHLDGCGIGGFNDNHIDLLGSEPSEDVANRSRKRLNVRPCQRIVRTGTPDDEVGSGLHNRIGDVLGRSSRDLTRESAPLNLDRCANQQSLQFLL
jgi:hypothetical protein